MYMYSHVQESNTWVRSYSTYSGTHIRSYAHTPYAIRTMRTHAQLVHSLCTACAQLVHNGLPRSEACCNGLKDGEVIDTDYGEKMKRALGTSYIYSVAVSDYL